jgi:hypothetical protein
MIDEDRHPPAFAGRPNGWRHALDRHPDCTPDRHVGRGTSPIRRETASLARKRPYGFYEVDEMVENAMSTQFCRETIGTQAIE